jgi:hypothetical protein
MPADISTGAQTLTAAGVVTGVLDVSAYTLHPTIKVEVLNLTAGAVARIAIEDTANSSEFSDALAACIFDVAGPLGTGEPGPTPGPTDQVSVTPDLTPSLRFGATHNQLRANLYLLSGSSPSVTLHAYVA